MAGVFPNETSIYIVAAGTNGSALTAADLVKGEITNVSISGLDRSKESIPVVGGFVDKQNPRSQGEVSFDVIINNTFASSLERWDLYQFPNGTSADEPQDKAIFLTSLSGSLWKTIAVNNASVSTSETTLAADDMLRKTVTLQFTPETPLGVANLRTSALATSSAFFNWA